MEELVKNNSWTGRRVFLTGHTGFKGTWLTLWLSRLGAQIGGYALDSPTEPNMFTAVRATDAVCEDVRGDILDRAKLETAMRSFAPEVVFHLAAQPLVRRSYADPLGTYAINVMGTAHVLESVRMTSSVRAVVLITTDKCYENREWVWPYRETDPIGGRDPYSSSKACVEILGSAYRSSFFNTDPNRVALATARAGNVIGGGDWSEDRLVPDLIRSFLNGQPALVRQPKAVRPWQHVLEPLHGYILLAQRLLEGDARAAFAFNFGPGDEGAWPVERIASSIADGWGEAAKWQLDEGPKVHEARLLSLDASKARAELGWRPRLSTETALQWTIKWYRAWRRRDDMRQETLAQINAYEQLLNGV